MVEDSGSKTIIGSDCKVEKMINALRNIIIVISVLASCLTAAYGQDISREQLKGLDEQVQEIKSDVLGIAAELSQLEEKLLYPSNTQIAVFVSLADGEKFRLDSVEVRLEGRPVAHHIYTFKELEALQKGGVQNIYTGNIRSGGHDLLVSMRGISTGGTDLEQTGKFTVNKDVGPKIVEISLAAHSITFKD